MKLSDKYTRAPVFANEPEPGTAMHFVYQYGQNNCIWLSFRPKAEVIASLEKDRGVNFERDLPAEERAILEGLFGCEVLAYLDNRYNNNPDVFVFPNNNVNFPLSCFHDK